MVARSGKKFLSDINGSILKNIEETHLDNILNE